MSTLFVSNGARQPVTMQTTEPWAKVGRWSGDLLQRPDVCYFCPIGERARATGHVRVALPRGLTLYGTCQAHLGKARYFKRKVESEVAT